MIDASPQREDEANQPIAAMSEMASSASEEAAPRAVVTDPGYLNQPIAPPLDGQATVMVPPLDEVAAPIVTPDDESAPNSEPALLVSETAPSADEAAPALETVPPAEATAPALETAPGGEVPPAPLELAAAAEATPLQPNDASNAGLAVRPAPRLPIEETPTEQAAEAATELVPEGEEEMPQLARRGRIELLPNEEIVYHLSALYLTNKRVLLYAPTVLRAAFLRDVDAMGMATERLPGGVFILGLVMMVVAALTGGLIYFDAHQDLAADSPLKIALDNVRDFLPVPVEWLALAVALLGIFFVVSYFFYISKSLFVSVHGRPLITVSISGYRPRNLDDIDNFINALAGAKDALSDTLISEE